MNTSYYLVLLGITLKYYANVEYINFNKNNFKNLNVATNKNKNEPILKLIILNHKNKSLGCIKFFFKDI